VPRREELEALVRHYHHLQNEHKRAPADSALRRRIDDRLLQVHERFERLLAEWVPEEELRQAWRDHLHYRASEPSGPDPIRPLLFRGVSDAGSVVEIRRKEGEELEVRVDGALIERLVDDKDFASFDPPPARLRLNGSEFHETFSASPEALEALADFLEDDRPPPWDYASELFEDGLIDVHFALTPRGRRALSQRG
jgi:hypothetical protein